MDSNNVEEDELSHLFQNLAIKAGEMWENAPDELKQSLPSMGAAIGQIGASISSYCNVDLYKNVLHNLKPENACSVEKATTWIDKLAKKWDIAKEKKDKIIEILCNKGGECPPEIKGELANRMRKAGNVILAVSFIAGVIQIVSQVMNIQKLNQVIQESERKIKQAQAKKQNIQTKIGVVKARLAELEPLLAKLGNANITQNEITRISLTLAKIDRSINRDIENVLKEIATLHKDLEAAVSHVKGSRQVVVSSSVGGLVSGITEFVNVGSLNGIASPWGLAATGIISGLNIVASSYGFWKCLKTEAELDKLMKELDEVEVLRCNAEGVQQALLVEVEKIENEITMLIGNESDDKA